MEVTRSRLSALAEWVTAGGLLVATLVVAGLVVREFRVASRANPSDHARSGDSASASAAIPPEAVSVSTLTLGQNEIRVGTPVAEALSRLGLSSQAPVLVRQTSERGPLGVRDIRWYQLSGTRFILVFEPFERGGQPRVAAIYLI